MCSLAQPGLRESELYKRKKEKKYFHDPFSFFPTQIQIFGFNSQLYNNFSEALHRAQGIVGVSLLLQVRG